MVILIILHPSNFEIFYILGNPFVPLNFSHSRGRRTLSTRITFLSSLFGFNNRTKNFQRANLTTHKTSFVFVFYTRARNILIPRYSYIKQALIEFPQFFSCRIQVRFQLTRLVGIVAKQSNVL